MNYRNAYSLTNAKGFVFSLSLLKNGRVPELPKFSQAKTFPPQNFSKQVCAQRYPNQKLFENDRIKLSEANFALNLVFIYRPKVNLNYCTTHFQRKFING